MMSFDQVHPGVVDVEVFDAGAWVEAVAGDTDMAVVESGRGLFEEVCRKLRDKHPSRVPQVEEVVEGRRRRDCVP